MAIYRREHLQPYLEELDTYYQALRQAVAGVPPHGELAPRFHANPEQFAREFREVDMERVLYQIEHFRASVNFVKNLKKVASQPVAP